MCREPGTARTPAHRRQVTNSFASEVLASIMPSAGSSRLGPGKMTPPEPVVNERTCEFGPRMVPHLIERQPIVGRGGFIVVVEPPRIRACSRVISRASPSTRCVKRGSEYTCTFVSVAFGTWPLSR